MANRKAGSAGDGSTGEAKRPAAGKKSAGTATGGADETSQTGGSTGARKGAAKSGGSGGTTRSGSTTADSQPAKTTGRAAAKGGAARSAQGGSESVAKGTGATKGAAKGATKGATKGAAKTGGRGAGKPDLRGDLRQFVSENPQGWEHDQWQGLLDRLGQRGHDTSNPDQIGMQLERERLSSRLEQLEGVSARKAKSLIERFGTVYSLRNADADEIAREGKVSRDVAERIKSQLG